MNYVAFQDLQQIVNHIIVIIVAFFLLLIFSRELGTINLSSHRKLVTKFFSFVIVTFARTLQIPVLIFITQVYSCDNDTVSIQQNTYYGSSYCFSGTHFQLTVYTSVVLVFYYGLVFYFQYFLTLSYPHEKIPWACLPTKIPFLIEFLKLSIVFCYQEINISQNALSYLNIVFAFAWLGILYKRLYHVLIFHTTVYLITICGEACMFIIYGYAAMRDFVDMDRNFILHIVIFITCLFFSITAVVVRDRIRYQFLSRVDFALYEKDFDALIMMFTLHELIERSSYDDTQDFILRGFIERHIEICEYSSCSCIKFY